MEPLRWLSSSLPRKGLLRQALGTVPNPLPILCALVQLTSGGPEARLPLPRPAVQLPSGVSPTSPRFFSGSFITMFK